MRSHATSRFHAAVTFAWCAHLKAYGTIVPPRGYIATPDADFEYVRSGRLDAREM